MPDIILTHNDQVIFLPQFGVSTVSPRPGYLRASGGAKLLGQAVCIKGDEYKVSVPGVMYTTPAYPLPGNGTLKIARLASHQFAQHTKSGGSVVLLKGNFFEAKFEVNSPASHPKNGPDPISLYPGGKGYFVSRNQKFKGT